MKANDKSEHEAMEFVAALYQTNYDKMVKFSMNAVYNKILAEDIVQDTYYEALRKADVLFEHPNPMGWLIETMKNKIRAFKRRAMHRNEVYEPECDQMKLAGMEEQFGCAELQLIIEDTLTPHEQQLFRLYFIQGYSARELAAMENISESSFKVRMCRIRKRLQCEVDGIIIVRKNAY